MTANRPLTTRLALAKIETLAHDNDHADVRYQADVSIGASDDVRAYVGRLRFALRQIAALAQEQLDA